MSDLPDMYARSNSGWSYLTHNSHNMGNSGLPDIYTLSPQVCGPSQLNCSSCYIFSVSYAFLLWASVMMFSVYFSVRKFKNPIIKASIIYYMAINSVQLL